MIRYFLRNLNSSSEALLFLNQTYNNSSQRQSSFVRIWKYEWHLIRKDQIHIVLRLLLFCRDCLLHIWIFKLNAFHFSSLHTFLAVNMRILLLHTAESTEKQFIILKNGANGFFLAAFKFLQFQEIIS